MNKTAIVALLTLVAQAWAGGAPRLPVRIYDCASSDTVTDSAISPDERYVALAIVQHHPGAAEDAVQTIRVLDFRKECALPSGLPAQKNEKRKLPHPDTPHLYGLHFTGNGAHVVFSDGGSVHVLRTEPLAEVWKFEIPARDHSTRIVDLAVARDAHVAAVLARPMQPPARPGATPQLTRRPEFLHIFRAYNLDTGAVRSDLRLRPELSAVSLALSPDGSRAAITVRPLDGNFTTSPDLLIVDVATGAILKEFRVRTNAQLAFVDNQFLYTLGPPSDGFRRRVKVVDVNTGQVVRDITEPKGRTLATLAASADGRFVGSGLWRNQPANYGETESPDEFFLWDGSSRELVARFKTNPAGPLKVSSSGRFLLVGTRIFEFELAPQSNAGSH
jgi:hypothetical protein